jgi:hypothetical protein
LHNPCDFSATSRAVLFFTCLSFEFCRKQPQLVDLLVLFSPGTRLGDD